MCVCHQVAGRLHVEVWRGSEGLEENTAQDVTDGDTQERKLKCVVRWCGCGKMVGGRGRMGWECGKRASVCGRMVWGWERGEVCEEGVWGV